ncbi:hypothetical protein PHLGIDRAFT_122177 [Phlebiopsis gigantea 11061_1 CR5-6]|uniref:JmjC domain-containing protein n=1 Tax=Phlebiopsis gigantea (strain 11061_1 CR5-6) TaxID=745531 RepID=A0A0C3S430_PHLG1|nr:hypothetical protein PHLGIDRAFT_122177 [Phlebiopsis gigantea 11061_1 CR5-6]
MVFLDSPAVIKTSHVLSYDEFLQSYLLPNRPVVIGPSLVKGWNALEKWTRDFTDSPQAAATREIDWSHLAEAYGDEEISVSDCSKVDSFGNLECESASFSAIVEEWKQGKGQSLYVKDWHLAKSVDRSWTDDAAVLGSPFYTTPDLFNDDWMNAYYSSHTSDDFRFVYVGAAGTYTPLHRDVYCSYSWSTNVCGRKRWWLFPPEQTPLLFMQKRNVCVHDVRDVDPVQFPGFVRTAPLVVEQEEGETIFVPSGWYHQVENLTACISINHNWCNSVNLPMLYASMCDKVVEVENALDDIRQLLQASHPDDNRSWKAEFCTVVQQLVEQDAGWNWLTFWRMVKHALHSAAAQEGRLPTLDDTIPCNPTSQPIFPCPPPHLRPPLSYISDQVRSCYVDFVQRDRFECEGDVETVIREVGILLDA